MGAFTNGEVRPISVQGKAGNKGTTIYKPQKENRASLTAININSTVAFEISLYRYTALTNEKILLYTFSLSAESVIDDSTAYHLIEGDYQFLVATSGVVNYSVEGLEYQKNCINPPFGTGGQVNVISAGDDSTGGLTNAELRATPVPVSGTLEIDSSLLATSAKQDTGNTSLASILAKLSADPATQTTLAAILAKIIAAPSTEAKQDSIITLLNAIGALLAGTLTVSGTVNANTGLSQPLTDTQLRVTPVPVSGTVTVDTSLLATQATLAALLAKVIAAPSTEAKQDALNALATTLNSIVATSSKQDSQTALLTTIDSDTSNLDVALSTRLKAADTLAGVTTVAAVTAITNALPAGTNAIGKLAANTGVDIGDVDITSVIPGTGATNLGKAEDAVHNSGDVGVMALGVVNENATILAENNDYVPSAYDRWGGIYISPETNSALFKGLSASFRSLGIAGTAGQKLLAIHNSTSSTVNVFVTKIRVDLMATVVKAVTVAPPVVRIWRFTAVPTNGTQITKNKVGGSTTSNAQVTLWNGSTADDTNSGTPLTVSLPAGTILDSQFASRIITAVGEVNTKVMEFDYRNSGGLELPPLTGICVFLDYVLATQNPVTDKWVASIEWNERTT